MSLTARRPRPLRLTLVSMVAAALVALAPSTAGAATRTVKMEPNSFSPRTITIARGDTVKWSNKGGFLEHDATSTEPAGYFYRFVPIGKAKSFTFRSAGRYEYTCTLHNGMDGTVIVPISVTRLTSPVRFRVQLASSAASSPWRHVLQVKKPGSSSFQTIATTTAASVTWRPQKTGTYTFRAKLMHATNGQDSRWSPTVSRTY